MSKQTVCQCDKCGRSWAVPALQKDDLLVTIRMQVISGHGPRVTDGRNAEWCRDCAMREGMIPPYTEGDEVLAPKTPLSFEEKVLKFAHTTPKEAKGKEEKITQHESPENCAVCGGAPVRCLCNADKGYWVQCNHLHCREVGPVTTKEQTAIAAWNLIQQIQKRKNNAALSSQNLSKS